MTDTRTPEEKTADTTRYGLHHCGQPQTVKGFWDFEQGILYQYLWCPACEVEA